MARAVRRSVKTKDGRARPAARARRVPVAKEKSRPRERTAARTTARTAPVEPAPAKARAKAAKPAKPATPRAAPAHRRKVARPAGPPRGERKPPPPVDAPPDEPVGLVLAAGAELTDEEQIESAKYQPRRAKARVFEEERFLFPQSYGVNRLRLLVKDPEWLFAYWDVDPRSLESLRAELGARASALSQLTLRVFEDRKGGASTFLLPQDARTWYVPVRTTGRAYRAEVGVILPSGEFRPLARSNSAAAPRVGRSAQKAKRRVRYDRSRPALAGAAGSAAGEEAAFAEDSWDAPLDAGARPEEERTSARSRGGRAVERGGASDLHRR